MHMRMHTHVCICTCALAPLLSLARADALCALKPGAAQGLRVAPPPRSSLTLTLGSTWMHMYAHLLARLSLLAAHPTLPAPHRAVSSAACYASAQPGRAWGQGHHAARGLTCHLRLGRCRRRSSAEVGAQHRRQLRWRLNPTLTPTPTPTLTPALALT